MEGKAALHFIPPPFPGTAWLLWGSSHEEAEPWEERRNEMQHCAPFPFSPRNAAAPFPNPPRAAPPGFPVPRETGNPGYATGD